MTGFSTPYQCFISYRRADDATFDGVVTVLNRQLAGRFAAETGTELQTFVDRDAIGWGDQWREKIADAIAGSTLFVPVITMQYFNSEICREELSAFHEAALAQGVTGLVLPIVLAGKSQITSQHPDNLVKLIASLNYKPIDDVWEHGYQSAEWKTRIGELVNGIADALQKATDTLLSQPSNLKASIADDVAITDQVSYPIDDVDAETLQNAIDAVGKTFITVRDAIQGISQVIDTRTDGRDVSKLSSGQRTFFFGALAQDLKAPASKFAEAASALEQQSVSADSQLRAYVAELRDIKIEEAQENLSELTTSIELTLEMIDGFSDSVSGLLETMRLTSLTSVPMRQAIQPVVAASKSLLAALEVMRSWRDLL